MDQIKALTDTAVLQLAEYPSLTSKEKIKRLVKSCIPGKAPAPLDAFSWPNALLAKGLLCAYEATGDTDALRAVADYLKRWKTKGFPIRYVDNLMNGTLAMKLEELLRREQVARAAAASEAEDSSTAKAAAASEAEKSSAAKASEWLALCREAADACAAWIQKAPRTAQGMIAYRKQHPDWLFADALAMVPPFACRYGKERGDKELAELGARQLTEFLKKGMDAKSGLPYHGYDEKTGMKYGIIGWGRACGWMLLGLAESLPYVEKDSEAYTALAAACGELTGRIFEYQREDGGFSWQLSALEGHTDSSAEGMIGLALALLKKEEEKTAQNSGRNAAVSECFRERDQKTARLYEKTKECVTAGKVESCSGECLGFAQYPQIYGSYPWGNGSVLGFLASWSKEWEE